jgi:hypothetical protein
MKTILEYKQELQNILALNQQEYPVVIADGYNVSNNITAQTIATYLATKGICISICPPVQETEFKKAGNRSIAKLSISIMIETNPKILPDFSLCDFVNQLIKLIHNMPPKADNYDWTVEDYIETEDAPYGGLITVTREVVI